MFETDNKFCWENINLLTKKKKISRNILVQYLPLSAFNSHSWFIYYCDNYLEIKGEKYPNLNNNEKSNYLAYIANIIKSQVYPVVFYDRTRQWSALDFSKFITIALKNTKDSEHIFTLQTFRKNRNRDLINSYVDKFDEILKKRRLSNKFERNTYIKHLDLSNAENDLFLIFDDFDFKSDYIPLVYNYGLPIYIRCLQKTKRTDGKYYSFDESRYFALKKLKNIILENQNDKEYIKKVITGIVKNSMLWEPYPIGKKLDFFNWRNELNSFIDRYEINKESWWKDKDFFDTLPTIPAIKKIFV
jgi:hypothetical protein